MDRVDEGVLAGGLEGDFLGVNRVVLAVVDAHADILHGIARDGAVCQDLDDAFLDGRQELPRDGLAEQGVDELEAASTLQRLYSQVHLAELPGPAGLLLVAVVSVGLGGDGLLVGDLRRLGVNVEVEPLSHLGQYYPQVQVADAADDGLGRLGVSR